MKKESVQAKNLWQLTKTLQLKYVKIETSSCAQRAHDQRARDQRARDQRARDQRRPREKLKFFSPADNRGESTVPQKRHKHQIIPFYFPLADTEGKKWHRMVLAPTEWHQAELYPLVIFAQLDSDGRLRPVLWGKLG